MNTYQITDSEQGQSTVTAADRDEAQEKYIDRCEEMGLVHGSLRISRISK